jgi:hypothetical protein
VSAEVAAAPGAIGPQEAFSASVLSERTDEEGATVFPACQVGGVTYLLHSSSIFTVSDVWRIGIVATLCWIVFPAVEAGSLLAVFAAPLLIGIWICAVVVIDRWVQSRNPR